MTREKRNYPISARHPVDVSQNHFNLKDRRLGRFKKLIKPHKERF